MGFAASNWHSPPGSESAGCHFQYRRGLFSLKLRIPNQPEDLTDCVFVKTLRDDFFRGLAAFYMQFQNPVELFVGRQAILIGLIRPQFG
jgi:hypothetical protein